MPKCKICGFYAKTRAGLTSHIRHKHPEKALKPLLTSEDLIKELQNLKATLNEVKNSPKVDNHNLPFFQQIQEIKNQLNELNDLIKLVDSGNTDILEEIEIIAKKEDIKGILAELQNIKKAIEEVKDSIDQLTYSVQQIATQLNHNQQKKAKKWGFF